MAIVNINYDCGCGFHAKTVEEAIEHVDESRHTLGVAGTIKSSERKVPKAKASSLVSSNPRSRTMKSSAVAPLQVQAESQLDFKGLRARLQSG